MFSLTWEHTLGSWFWLMCTGPKGNPPDVCVDEQLVPFIGVNSVSICQASQQSMDWNLGNCWCCHFLARKCQIYTGKVSVDTMEVRQGKRVILEMTEEFQGSFWGLFWSVQIDVVLSRYFPHGQLVELLMVEGISTDLVELWQCLWLWLPGKSKWWYWRMCVCQDSIPVGKDQMWGRGFSALSVYNLDKVWSFTPLLLHISISNIVFLFLLK